MSSQEHYRSTAHHGKHRKPADEYERPEQRQFYNKERPQRNYVWPQMETVNETTSGRIIEVTDLKLKQTHYVVHLWDNTEKTQFTVSGVFDQLKDAVGDLNLMSK